MVDRLIIEGTDRYIIIEPTPTYKIDNAFSLVRKAIEGRYGFAWRDIYKYKYKHADDMVRDRFRTDEECEALKNKLQSQHAKLKSALKLLTDEGYVDHYTCLNSGRLEVSFFQEAIRINLTVLDETFLKKLQVFYEVDHRQHQRIKQWWRYWPGDYKPQRVGQLITRTREEYEYQLARVHERRLQTFKEYNAEKHEEWLTDQRKVNRTRRITKLVQTGANIF